MAVELRTFLWFHGLSPGLVRRSLGRSLAAALLALSALQPGCDGDDAVDSAGGAAGAGTPPRADGTLDTDKEDRAGGAGGGRPEAGDSEIGAADQRAADRASDVVPDDDAAVTADIEPDAVEEPGNPPHDASEDARDTSLDRAPDASSDGDDGAIDAPPDVPRDTGPIVVGPRFWRSVRFAVFGDYGVATTDEARVSNLVHSWDVDFVITTGDNNYTGNTDGIDGVIGQYYSDFIGNYWGTFGPGSRTTRFWPSPGNHDWDVADLRAYTDYFTLPGNERYYDISLGLVHLFALDSDPREPDGTTADSVQARWLQSALARSTSCFNVVYFHHPPYSSGPHGSSFEMRWPFEQWGADVVLAGHDHIYERLEVGEIPYFVTGLGGASPYPFVTTIPESRAQFNSDFGAMRVTANRRGMRFEFIDANGTLVDSSNSWKRCR